MGGVGMCPRSQIWEVCSGMPLSLTRISVSGMCPKSQICLVCSMMLLVFIILTNHPSVDRNIPLIRQIIIFKKRICNFESQYFQHSILITIIIIIINWVYLQVLFKLLTSYN